MYSYKWSEKKIKKREQERRPYSGTVAICSSRTLNLSCTFLFLACQNLSFFEVFWFIWSETSQFLYNNWTIQFFLSFYSLSFWLPFWQKSFTQSFIFCEWQNEKRYVCTNKSISFVNAIVCWLFFPHFHKGFWNLLAGAKKHPVI